MADDKIVPGLRGRRETIVCEHNVAGHVDKFSTPSMIGLMEQASHLTVQHLLDAGQTSVGFEVNVRHIAPASLGDKIIASSELTDVNGNRLTFKVEAYAGEIKIGEGTHRRAIIGGDANKQ